MTTYQYSPLSASAHEIRVLVLRPGAFDSDIQVSLATLELRRDRWAYKAGERGAETFEGKEVSAESNEVFPSTGVSDSEHQDFEALSYEWGSKDDPGSVTISSAPARANTIQVTRNLDSALRHIRLDSKSRVLWVDAICVNQNDLDERSQQVALMGATFKLAKRVIIWLGPAMDDSDHALEALEHLGEGLSVDWSTLAAKVSFPDSWTTQDSHAVWRLLSRGYFERLWVRQEVRLAADAIVWCGNRVIHWKNLSDAVYRLNWSDGELHRAYHVLVTQAYRLCKSARVGLKYRHLRKNLRGLRWTDDRDTIFAFSNLLTDEDRELAIEADYNKPTQAVFEQQVRRIYTERRSLDVLRSCELSSRRIANLPTWVPDWSSQMEAHRQPRFVWSACGWISAPEAGLTVDSLTLTGIKGGVVGHVMRLDGPETADTLRSFLVRITDLRDKFTLEQEGEEKIDEKVARSLGGYAFAEDYYKHPSSDVHLPVSQQLTALRQIYSEGSISESWDSNVNLYFSSLRGRTIIIMTDGAVGSAPAGSQPGDEICVVLGCAWPVALRRRGPDVGDDDTRWQVVGPCLVPGLMHGEAIYGEEALAVYQPVCHGVPGLDEIDHNSLAFRHKESGDLNTDPAAILREFGIRPASYRAQPHLLDVPWEELASKGIKLEEFLMC